jgi:uncharacterized protein YjiS (DUF1127 family)
MSAPIAKDQLAFSLGNLSYIGPHYEDAQQRPLVPGGGFVQWVVARAHAIGAWFEKQTALRELEMMSDRELSDIGLARADLRRVFDPGFVSDVPRGRDYIAY